MRLWRADSLTRRRGDETAEGKTTGEGEAQFVRGVHIRMHAYMRIHIYTRVWVWVWVWVRGCGDAVPRRMNATRETGEQCKGHKKLAVCCVHTARQRQRDGGKKRANRRRQRTHTHTRTHAQARSHAGEEEKVSTLFARVYAQGGERESERERVREAERNKRKNNKRRKEGCDAQRRAKDAVYTNVSES